MLLVKKFINLHILILDQLYESNFRFKMIRDLIKFYQIGKELGLSRKEINSCLFFGRSKFYRALFIIMMMIIFFVWFFSLSILNGFVSQNIYARGTGYSTIKLKDFKKKMRKFFWI